MSYVYQKYEGYVLHASKCIHKMEEAGDNFNKKCKITFEDGHSETKNKQCDDIQVLNAYFSKVDYRCFQDVNSSTFGAMPDNNMLYLSIGDYFFLMSLLGVFIGYVTLRGLK